ncbi:MAG: S9 family peptidase [Bacteroidia bacterium]|nr:S9 family peptidase [Bacteroidia bacterium]
MQIRLWVTLLLIWSLQVTRAQVAGQIKLESIWLSAEYFPDFPDEFRWMQDDQYYSVLDPGKGIYRYSVANDKQLDAVLDFSKLDLGSIKAEDIETYEFSGDERQVLLKTQVTPIYRHSSTEVCLIADRNSGTVRTLHGGKPVSLATFSPDGSQIAYVFENNLYAQALAGGDAVQVTQDGLRNHIINGAADWVYEEEFALTSAFAWSPDGTKIAFYRFDESQVQEFSMAVYGSLYPVEQRFKYPKAGEANAIVSIHIYDLAARRTVMCDVGPERDQYIPRILWAAAGSLGIMRMNRLQNQVDVLLADPATGATRLLLSESSPTYIREPADFSWYFLADGRMLWLSERDGYQHVYLYDAAGALIRPVTSGAYEVTDIIGVDEKNERLYYRSTEVSPLERHFYVIGLNGKKKEKLSREAGSHDVTASTQYNYFVETWSNISQPPVTRLCDPAGKVLRVLADNQKLQKKVEALTIAAPAFFDFETPDKVRLNGWMIKPPTFDPARQYPVLMFVYGGPGSQEVMNDWGLTSSFNYLWHQMLAQQGYIIVCVDNRGTGGRGRDFRAVTYADLGRYEVEDQLHAARYLQSLPYVDDARIGIWGWSYGGYMTSLCMTKGQGLFKTGIAVAPVTNWRFYDTIYTERYLKTPQLNPDGYDKNSPINYAANLKGNYFLVHGTADDNVHYQNSMEMVDALVKANKQFDTFFYPNKNHGIYGGYTRYHLFNKMTRYILANL